MPKEEALIELAERCEKATGPDRELDQELFDLLWPLRSLNGLTWREGGTRGILTSDALTPRYTSSLDAAMSLVPEGWLIEKQGEYPFPDDESRPFFCRVRPRHVGKADQAIHVMDVATPALALTAAAIRSRASQVHQ